MGSRAFAIVLASWLPCLVGVLPFSSGHAVNAMIAGILATVLSAVAMVDDRARVGASLAGAWIAFTPLFSTSTLLEMVVQVCWGTTMFVFLGGPFSAAPSVTRVPAQPVETRVLDDAPSYRTAA
jgi:hypothetical protein